MTWLRRQIASTPTWLRELIIVGAIVNTVITITAVAAWSLHG